MTLRPLLALCALVSLTACDSFEEVEGEVLPDNLVVETVDLVQSAGGAVTLTATVRNEGDVGFSVAALAFTVEGEGEGPSRLAGGVVPGGLAAGARGVIAETVPDVAFRVDCYRYTVEVDAATANQTVSRAKAYPGTCGD
ncbi:hypothetical protein RQM47_10780 [Rubrivirga sp. S365]|uniref:CARDB domain-containing protein n=1 Tax=Rubrivirga litoralis TaxID=3075598 RepID=A0ABU3BUT6_9BACT|nr:MULTISPECIES: hypothetical protein [unclassified Rubrivirga]MDT0633058.1 hypothetical protein [Rubrivirga sp. F394]MDT7857125.1 hypothetical protein [Rubrivirga sp. S365]